MAESDTDTEGGRQIPTLDEVINMELQDNDERRWIVLFDEDYDNVLIDADDSVAILVDNNQACELMRLTSKVIGALAPSYAPDKEPIEAMIDALQDVADGRDDD